jgi:hypothetical protein
VLRERMGAAAGRLSKPGAAGRVAQIAIELMRAAEKAEAGRAA